MKRRSIITTLSMIGISGVAGCIADSGSAPNDETTETYRPGESFEYRGVEYNVTEVTIEDRLYVGFTRYGASKGATLVRIRLQMTNIGKSPIAVPLLEGVKPILIDNQGREYSRKQTILSAEEIGAGLSERALFYFEVPKDQTSRFLEIGPHRVELIETSTPEPTPNNTESPDSSSTGTEGKSTTGEHTAPPRGQADISVSTLRIDHKNGNGNSGESDVRLTADVEFIWDVPETQRWIVNVFVGPDENNLELLTFRHEDELTDSGRDTISFNESVLAADAYSAEDFNSDSSGTERTDIVVSIEFEVRGEGREPLVSKVTKEVTINH